MTTFDKILIRCSAIGGIMAQPQDATAKNAGELGKTAKTYLTELYLELKYNRKKEFGSKYIDKGIEQEEAGITLYNLEKCKGKILKKNTERICNEYLTGEPDGYIGESLIGCSEGFDIKNSWSLHTFPMFEEKLNKDYYWQAMGYMALTNAPVWKVVFTLCNCSAEQVNDEKQRVWYKLGQPSDDHPNFSALIEQYQLIERNMIFDLAQFKKDFPGYDLETKDWRYDIPRCERVKEFTVERDESAIQSIYNQVIKSRKYMADTFGSPVLLAEHDHQVNATIISKA